MKKVYDKFQDLKRKYPGKINVNQYGKLVKTGKFYLTTNGEVVFFFRNMNEHCRFSNGRNIFTNPEIYNFEVEPRCELSLLPTVQETIGRNPLNSYYAYTMSLILEFGAVADYFNISEILEMPETGDILYPVKTVWQRIDIAPGGKVINFKSSENLQDLRCEELETTSSFKYKVGDKVEFFANNERMAGKVEAILPPEDTILNYKVTRDGTGQLFWVAEDKFRSTYWYIGGLL